MPDRAIDNDQGRKVLRVVDEKDQVATRPVRLGALHEGLRVIEEGLKGDDQVIVRPNQDLTFVKDVAGMTFLRIDRAPAGKDDASHRRKG